MSERCQARSQDTGAQCEKDAGHDPRPGHSARGGRLLWRTDDETDAIVAKLAKTTGVVVDALLDRDNRQATAITTLRTAMVDAHTELVNAYNRSPRELGILHTDVSRAMRILEEALAKVPA